MFCPDINPHSARPSQPQAFENPEFAKQWFVMRDLKRSNAKLPAYKQLAALGMEIFTPMCWRLSVRQGRRVRERVPFIHDLLFVHEARQCLDSVVARIPTLQYRYQKGQPYCDPMVVRDDDMTRFVSAVAQAKTPRYYRPEEMTADMFGRRIRIVGGGLDGHEGYLLALRGARGKRLLVELPGWLTAAVEVKPEYIEVISDGPDEK